MRAVVIIVFLLGLQPCVGTCQGELCASLLVNDSVSLLQVVERMEVASQRSAKRDDGKIKTGFEANGAAGWTAALQDRLVRRMSSLHREQRINGGSQLSMIGNHGQDESLSGGRIMKHGGTSGKPIKINYRKTPAAKQETTESKDVVLVIGGGFKGITAAVNIAAQKKQQVVLVEINKWLLRSMDDIVISRNLADYTSQEILGGEPVLGAGDIDKAKLQQRIARVEELFEREARDSAQRSDTIRTNLEMLKIIVLTSTDCNPQNDNFYSSDPSGSVVLKCRAAGKQQEEDSLSISFDGADAKLTVVDARTGNVVTPFRDQLKKLWQPKILKEKSIAMYGWGPTANAVLPTAFFLNVAVTIRTRSQIPSSANQGQLSDRGNTEVVGLLKSWESRKMIKLEANAGLYSVDRRTEIKTGGQDYSNQVRTEQDEVKSKGRVVKPEITKEHLASYNKDWTQGLLMLGRSGYQYHVEVEKKMKANCPKVKYIHLGYASDTADTSVIDTLTKLMVNWPALADTTRVRTPLDVLYSQMCDMGHEKDVPCIRANWQKGVWPIQREAVLHKQLSIVKDGEISKMGATHVQYGLIQWYGFPSFGYMGLVQHSQKQVKEKVSAELKKEPMARVSIWLKQFYSASALESLSAYSWGQSTPALDFGLHFNVRKVMARDGSKKVNCEVAGAVADMFGPEMLDFMEPWLTKTDTEIKLQLEHFVVNFGNWRMQAVLRLLENVVAVCSSQDLWVASCITNCGGQDQ